MYVGKIGTGAALGGTLAVTGTNTPIGWYALIGVALLVTGLILLRVAAQRRRRHRTESA